MSKGLRSANSALKSLIITAGVIVFLIAIQPFMWSWIRSSAEDLHNQRTTTQQIANLNEQLAKIDEELASETTINQQVDVALIQESEISQAIERLEQTAQELGLELNASSIETSAAQVGKKTTPLIITVSVTGPIEKILQYVESIEHFTEVTSIHDFRLTPAPAQLLPGVPASPRYSLIANIAFITEVKPEDIVASAEGSQGGFVSTTTPALPPDGSGISSGALIAIGSTILLVVLLVVRYMQGKKKEA